MSDVQRLAFNVQTFLGGVETNAEFSAFSTPLLRQ
jgi:hypothetical protein